MPLKKKKIGFLGAGNMAEALIRGLLKTGLVPPESIFTSDVRRDRLEMLGRLFGIHTLGDNLLLVRRADVLILSVKPQIIRQVLEEIAQDVTSDKLVISIAAGVPTDVLRAHLKGTVRLIRTMPNTPALVLEGATAIALSKDLQPGDLEIAQEIFSAVGKVVVLEEELMDTVTGLSGSGPAYVALVVEALADGGVKMGLSRDVAMTLAAQTVLGSAKFLLETGEHPGRLKDLVTSPGGTAIAGIATLEEGGLRTTLINAVERATRRSRELGQGKVNG